MARQLDEILKPGSIIAHHVLANLATQSLRSFRSTSRHAKAVVDDYIRHFLR